MTDEITTEGAAPSVPDVDAVVIGAGFAGMYMVHRLLESDFTVQAFETGDGVGGTWYWNRYPGARCDVESLQYSYSFSDELQQEWDWTERYATQPEILRYAEHVADRFELRKHISFNTKVVAAHFDDENQLWIITTDTGRRVTAKYCVSAVGCLSDSRIPEWPGLDDFAGSIYHTGRWPHHAVDLRGHRVGVVGTGSSGIQLIPAIAPECEQLYVFQRTPNYTIPARNRQLGDDELRTVKAGYAELRAAARRTGGGNVLAAGTQSALEVSPAEREQEYERRWQLGGNGFVTSYTDIFLDVEANETAAEFVRERIRELVADPEIAEKLTPRNHPIGSKRICVDTDYYATFNRDNVHLVDVSAAPIEAITPTGLRTSAGEYELDTLIFATGYDAMTGPLLRMDIRGANGVQLADEWAAGPRTYLGLAIAGFPNLFVITGPGSPSVLANVIMSIEQHVDWIIDLLVLLRERKVPLVEADRASQDAWVDHVNELASRTIYPKANSWYLGSNVPGKTRVFMPYVGGLHNYRNKCDEVAAAGYPGFLMTAER